MEVRLYTSSIFQHTTPLERINTLRRGLTVLELVFILENIVIVIIIYNLLSLPEESFVYTYRIIFFSSAEFLLTFSLRHPILPLFPKWSKGIISCTLKLNEAINGNGLTVIKSNITGKVLNCQKN